MEVRKFLTIVAVFLLLISTLSMSYRLSAGAQNPEATLGNILDHGVDTHGNGLYDYLEVDIQVNVTVAGNFEVYVYDLMGAYPNESIAIVSSQQGFLDPGIQYMNVTFSGPAIFNSGIDIEQIGEISLLAPENGMYRLGLDLKLNVTLSRVYRYTEFDFYAFLTGRISDRGVDTDNDGLFNYLEVGIEFNVTVAGQYSVGGGGLLEQGQTPWGNGELYSYESVQENCNVGICWAYLNFSGPEIVYYHFNPASVSGVALSYSGGGLSWLGNVPLSMQYNYTLFDAPSSNIQVNFKVYPDATIAVDGALNFTNMYPENTYVPPMNASIGFETTGNTTTETSNGTVVFSGTPYSSLNATEVHASEVYQNGIQNDTINASTTLPQQEASVYPYNTTDVNLNAAYSGGLFNVDVTGQTTLPTILSTVFPFNMSDATMLANFDGTTMEGNITFHTIAGFPFGDVTVNFSGNRTSLQFNGNVNVTYSNFDDLQVNETNVDQFVANLNANFTGQGSNSLYNATSGYATCNYLNLTQIPYSDPTLGQDVIYNGTIIGNFTGAIAALMFPSGSTDGDLQQLVYASLESAGSSVSNASLVLNYYYESQIAQVNLHLTCDSQTLYNNLITLVPPATPPSWSSILTGTQMAALLKIANATSYAVKDAGLNASYSSADGEMSYNAWLVSNDSQLENDLVSILPDLAPQNSSYLNYLYESYLNTTYTTVNSSTTTLDLVNGTMTFASTETIQGDFEAELNQEKSIYIDEINATEQLPQGLPWELQLLNETDINIDNFQAQFGLGQDWAYANFSGLILKPPADNVDSITFKLKSWLSTTADLTPPSDFENFTVTITGGSSNNETVLLSAPSDVPAPDQTSLNSTSMTWSNASLSSLQDLTFLTAFNQQVSYQGGTYNVPILTNSTVTNFAFDPNAMQVAFNVTGPAGSTGFCNVTVPRNLLNAGALSDWTVIFDGRTLNQGEFSVTENAQCAFIYLNYTHSEHQIIIKGTQVLPEFQPNILPIAFAIPLIIIAITAIKQRKKLRLRVRLKASFGTVFQTSQDR
jgi:hypothetical protein